MCNLYGHRVSRWEYNAYFQADDERRREIMDELEQREPLPELEKTYTAPGKPGYVVREIGGRRQLEIMKWGFCTRKPRKKPAREGEMPFVTDWWTNARNLTSNLWRPWLLEPKHRCLVPFGRFSEPKAAPDRKAPGDLHWWFSVTDQPISAFAGVWKRDEHEGEVFAFLTTEPNPLVAPKHEKAMPVILHPSDYDRWLTGTMDDVLELQAPFPSQLMTLEE